MSALSYLHYLDRAVAYALSVAAGETPTDVPVSATLAIEIDHIIEVVKAAQGNTCR